MTTRIFRNTFKQIVRSRWVAVASIAVMMLAFFVATIFGTLGYVSNLYIQFAETRPSIYVFFDIKVPEARILEFKTLISQIEQIQRVEYTSWDKAVSDYRDYTARTQAEITGAIKDNSLPASLDVRLSSLEHNDEVFDLLKPQVDKLNDEFGGDDSERIVWLAQDKEKIEEMRQVFSTLRIVGGVIFSLFLLLVFMFTLITVEFRTYNRAEEIGVMQLVGGSLGFIRMPYVLEGAVYGLLGAILSTILLIGSYWLVFVWQHDSEFSQYIIRWIARLPWPEFRIEILAILLAVKLIAGGVVGALSSLVAIIRYVK